MASSPGRLSLLMAVLLAIGLLAGIAAVIGVSQRRDHLADVRSRSGPLTLSAQQLYRSLSDADATAAAAFLSVGAEPADLRQRYEQDIAAAGAALAQVGTADAASSAVEAIARNLPMYTGLVETARAYNRQNLPIGSAYLREASALMRDTILVSARKLYDTVTAQLEDERSAAAGLPWLALALVILTLVGLIWAQRYLSRRTHRTFNVGLVSATAAGLALLLWLGVSWTVSASHLHAADADGAAQVKLLSQVRIATLQARADEALTLVAHGSGADFEKDFTAQLDGLLGAKGKRGLVEQAHSRATDDKVRQQLNAVAKDLAQWRTAHQKLRDLDDNGDSPKAVEAAIGGQDGSTATLFNRIDHDLSGAIDTTSAAFKREADRAAGALAAAGLGFGTFTLVLLAGVAVGLTQRIAEYR
jgi:hypothetical protein